MAYFPHNQEEDFENPRLNKFENNYPVSKSRNYSPDNKNKITQRIIRYFEDPKEAKALAEIKKLSNKAKNSSKNVGSSLVDFIGTDDLKNNTELNRVMFKNKGDDYELEQPNIKDPFPRRKFKFSTQRYVPKNKNMTLIDEIRDKQNKNNNDEDNTQYKHKRDKRIIRFSVDNGYDNDNKKDNNINKNYNSSTSKPASNHASNFRRYKKLKSENIARPRFVEKKSDIKSINDDPKKIEIMEGAFNNIPDEYKAKNNVTVKNLDNKEQIVINEYHTKNKNAQKNYKTEYVWDKSINRLVEKRIYLDKDEINNDNNDNNEGRTYNNNSKNYNNKYKRFDDEINNRNKEDNKPQNEEKEEIEEKRKVNFKYSIDKDNKDKGINKNKEEDEDNKIGERKRFGNSSVILNKEMKNKSEKEEKERDGGPNQNQNNVSKENRFYPRYRNYKRENKEEEEKPKEVEIVIEKKTIIEKLDKPINETPQKEKEKENSNISPNRRIYKKRLNNIVIYKDKYENENERNNDKKTNEASPKAEPKYIKRPYYQPIENLSKTIYTKKIISEDKIPKKRDIFPEKKYEKKINKFKEKIPIEIEEKVEQQKKFEKKFEKKEGKVSRINPFIKYEKKNIKIKALQEEVDNEIEDKNPKMHNIAYSNYIKNKGSRNDKNRHKAVRSTSELIEDLEKIENYNVNTYLKNNDLLEIYDNINDEFNDFKNDIFYTNINSFEVNVGEFDKYKIPFLKKKTNAEDLCRGRVTSEDIYRKYSQNAKKYEKKKLFE